MIVSGSERFVRDGMEKIVFGMMEDLNVVRIGSCI
jgi:hypothetical protein